MKKFPVGIIGGTGGIGRWFADFFAKEGYPVHVSGRKTGLGLSAMAERCPVVIVSVPIGATCDVIDKVGPYMKKESLLMDFTSLKTAPVTAMLKSSLSEVIGLHPLFGPSVPALTGQNIAVCPARGETWLAWLKDILERNGARLVETTPERHDEMMALVQCLTHLNSMAMGLVLGEAGVGLDELRKFSTPVFEQKLSMIEKVFKDSPVLYAEIVALNPHVHKILGRYEEVISALKRSVEGGGAKGLTELITKHPVE
jgi:prephenate dehydrogenase